MEKHNQNKKHISARVSEPVHRTLTEAARISDLSLNQFLIQAALERAQLVLKNAGVVASSLQNAETVVNATDNPPAANNENLAPVVASLEDSARDISQTPPN